MKRIYTLDEIDCANCAAKLETALSKVDGVKNVSINFFSQKMTLEADDNEFDGVLKSVISLVKKLEPDCKVVL